MMRTSIGRWAFHKIAIWLLAIVAASCGAGTALAADQALAFGDGPKIASARIGLKNHYKLGFWTAVRVEVTGAGAVANLSVEVTAADSDGVPTTLSATLPPEGSADGDRTAVVYTMAGRVGSPVKIELVKDGQRIDTMNLVPNAKAKTDVAIVPVPATSELIVSLGTTPFGLKDAFADRDASGSQPGRKLIELDGITDLPTDWFGYDGVDVLVIAAGDGKLSKALAEYKAKFAALQRWIELGGRLVILCSGKHSEAMLGENEPLASLAPGTLAEVVRLPDAGPLERFAAVVAPIAGAEIQVPRLEDVVGSVDAYSGRRPTDLPLVVRSARGFGEITFVGVEFSEPPLSTWSGRTAFLRALLRPYVAEGAASDSSQRLMTTGFNDLSGALRQQMGRTFRLVVPIGFPIVTGLALAYLLFLGPLDYMFVNRWVRRPLMAWISFPIIVAAFSVIAIAVGNWSKGSANARVNQMELVDIDTMSGQARGTFWATLYSPDARRFDLAVKLPMTASSPTNNSEMLFSWWGLPGLGIGGMQTGGADLGIVRSGYSYGPDRESLEQVPVLASATKSVLARWSVTLAATIDAALTDEEGLATGTITNQTGVDLRNVRLLYGSWAYRLGTLKPGAQMKVGEELSPRSTKTIVTRDALGESGATAAQLEGRVFSAEQATAKDILSLMMFYNTAGGYGFAHLPNRYQAYCDLSRQLELGRAILVGEAPAPSAQLVDNKTGRPIGDEELDTATVVYRFVLPVKREAAP
jgi:hypothetical protein